MTPEREAGDVRPAPALVRTGDPGASWVCHGSTLSGDAGLKMTGGSRMPCLHTGVNPAGLRPGGHLGQSLGIKEV